MLKLFEQRFQLAKGLVSHRKTVSAERTYENPFKILKSKLDH